MINFRTILRLSKDRLSTSNFDRLPPIGSNTQRCFSVSSKLNADVDIKTENGIRTITINRPNKRNALSTDMYEAMTNSLAESNDDKATKVVVITGTGDFFTSGNDIASLAEAYQKKTPVREMGFAKFTRGLIDCRKPIVALVNGNAVGIGVTMLPHCETVYATAKAMFNTPFINLGIPPECCSSYLLPKTMGHTKAGEMLHFNAMLNAQEAYTSNLITRVFPDDKFETEAWERIRKMAEHPLKSLVHSKELLRGSEREHLHKVHNAENEGVDMDIVAQAVMNFMSKAKK